MTVEFLRLPRGAKTVQDVINDINTASGALGVTASFATTGNGIVLTDTAGGAAADRHAAELVRCGGRPGAHGARNRERDHGHRRECRPVARVVCGSGKPAEGTQEQRPGRNHHRMQALANDQQLHRQHPRAGRGRRCRNCRNCNHRCKPEHRHAAMMSGIQDTDMASASDKVLRCCRRRCRLAPGRGPGTEPVDCWIFLHDRSARGLL